MRSSNFSEPDSGALWFLERCLEALENEVPIAYRLVVCSLEHRTIAIDIGGDAAVLSMASGRHHLSRDVRTGCAIELTLSEPIVGCLLEARCTVLDAVLGGDVVVRGAAEDLAALHDALVAFIQGAVRSPSAPRLFDAYLRRAALVNSPTRRPDDPHGERHDVLQR